MEPEEASKLLDKQAEKDHHHLVGRVLREAQTFGPEGKKARSVLRRALLGEY